MQLQRLTSEEYIQRLSWTLAECISWYHSSSPDLRLNLPNPHPVRDEEGQQSFSWLHAPERDSIVQGIVSTRRRLLGQIGAAPVAPASDLAGGKLLFSAPQMSFLDGAVSEASRGFIDVHDAPPWDTWLSIAQESRVADFYEIYLVSWVPPQFTEAVDTGIGFSFVHNIEWASDVQSELSHALAAAGLA